MHKQITAKFYILMVSFLLLNHAVIPHIHYDHEIVFTGTVNHLNQESCKKHHHHHSDSKGDAADSCILKQVFLSRANDTDSTEDFQQWTKTQHNTSNVLFAILYFAQDYFYTPPTHPPTTFYFDSFYSYLGSGSINSRGSPLA